MNFFIKARHEVTSGQNYASCTALLSSELQMQVDGEWQTVVNSSGKTSLYTNDAKNHYVKRWLESASSTGTNTSHDAYTQVQLEPKLPLTDYGADKLKDPLRIEMRHLVTAPHLPYPANTSTQAFTFVIKYRCEDNKSFSQTWYDSSVVITDPNFKYVVNADNSGSPATITRKLPTASSDEAYCKAGMLTTIEMLWDSGDWVPLYTDGVLIPANVPTSFVTGYEIDSGNKGILAISTEDITVFDNDVQTNLDEPVVISFRISTRDYWSDEIASEAFNVTFVHECADNFVKRTGTAPATTLDYEILAAGSTPTQTWRSRITSNSLTRCNALLDTYVEYEENGTWIDIWNDISGSSPATWKTWLTITHNGNGDVTLSVQTNDESLFTGDLVQPESFNLRVRTNDPRSDHATRELVNTMKVTFTYNCATATLSASPALTTEHNYVVEADGATAATTDTTTVSLSVSGCQAKNEINTLIEIFHQGAFITFKSETGTDPNSIQATYPWLTATLRGSGANDKMSISIDSDTYSGFPTSLVEKQTYFIRVKTWDKWTPDQVYYQESTINFTHQCSGNQLSVSTALAGLLTYTVQADGSTPASATQTSLVTGTIAGCHNGSAHRLKTSIELWEDGEWQTIRDDAGTAVGPCSGAGTSCSASYLWLKTFSVSSGNSASIVVEESDFNNFENKLADDVTFFMRVKTVDFWSTDVSNPTYQSINIVFTHQCRTSVLTQTLSPVAGLDMTYTVEADGATNTQTRSSTVTSSIAACHSSPDHALKTSLELWQDGEFRTLIDEAGTKLSPCTGAPCTAPYKWINTLTWTTYKAQINVDVDDYTWFDNELVEPVTFFFRINHRDIFSHDDSKLQSTSFTVTFKHECSAGVLSSTTVPTDVLYTVQADGTTPPQTRTHLVTSNVASCNKHFFTKIQIKEDGNWVTIWGEDNSAKTTFTSENYNDWLSSLATQVPSQTISSYAVTGQADFTIDLDDPTLLPKDLVDDVVFELRAVTRDRWATDLSNPVENAFTVTFQHECYTNVLTRSSSFTGTSSSTGIDYVIQADFSQANGGAVLTTTPSIAACKHLYTTIELLQDGFWQPIRDDTNTQIGACASGSSGKCLDAAPYSWLTQFTVNAAPVSTNAVATFVVKTDSYNDYDGTDKLQSEFKLRAITRDKWSRDVSNPVTSAFTVTINYECQSDFFAYKAGQASVGQQEYELATTPSFLTRSVDWTPIVEQSIAGCPHTHPIYVFNNITRVWDEFSTSPLNTDFTISDTSVPAGYALSFTEAFANAPNEYLSKNYAPEVYYLIKVVWKSTYSEYDIKDASLWTLEDEFWLHIFDPCKDNVLTLNTNTADATYYIDTTAKTYTANSYWSASLPLAKCPITRTCYIWNNSKDVWETNAGSCNIGDDVNFFQSFDSDSLAEYTVHMSKAQFQSAYPNHPDFDFTYKVKIRIEDLRSITKQAWIEDEFDVTIRYSCNEFTIEQDSSDIGRQDPILIDHGTQKTITLSFTQSANSNACILIYGLEFWNDDTKRWDAWSSGTYGFASWTAATGYQMQIDANYDTHKWSSWPNHNVTAKLWVSAPETVQTKNYVEDTFKIVIVEKCRLVEKANSMIVRSQTTNSVSKSQGGHYGALGTGTEADPYKIEMFDRLQIGLTRTTYGPTNGASEYDYSDPLSYNRCVLRTTLHYSNGDRTLVDQSNPTYMFDQQTTNTYPLYLAMQWNTPPPNNDLLYGKYNTPEQQIIFSDYLVVRSQVVYEGASGVSDDEVIVQDEATFFLQVTNPCIVKDGGAVKPQIIADIEYWIKETQHQTRLNDFEDYPTINHYDSVGSYNWDGNSNRNSHYLYRNINDMCGSKSYEILMADKVTPNSNTAFLNLAQDTSTYVDIRVYTTNPVYFTNANVQYYLKVTLDDYVYHYPQEAVYYEPFRLNMRNCIVESFNIGSWVTNQEYILYTPVEKYPYDQWTHVALAGTSKAPYTNCQHYPITYTVKWINFYETKLEISDMSGVNGNFIWNQIGSGVHDAPSFWIQSDDLIDPDTARQTYTIELTASISITDMNPIYTQSETFELKIVNNCPSDVLTNLVNSFTDYDGCASPPCEYTYYIGEHTDNFAYNGKTAFQYDAAKPLTHERFHASWQTSVPFCPLDFEITRDANLDGTYTALTATEQSVVSLINKMEVTTRVPNPADPTLQWHTWQEQFPQGPLVPTTYTLPNNVVVDSKVDYNFALSTPSSYTDAWNVMTQWQYYNPQVFFQINTSNMLLDGEIWKLAVNRKSTRSTVNNDSARIEFTLNLKDVCWDIPIEKSEPTQTTLTVDLWSKFTFTTDANSKIQSALSWPTETTYCGGGFTHYVLYDSTSVGQTPSQTVAPARLLAHETVPSLNAIFGTPTGSTFEGPDAATLVFLTKRDWVGTHSMKLRTVVGTTANKLYNTNYLDSNAWTLEVVNPCETATFDIIKSPRVQTSPGVYESVPKKPTVTLLEAREQGGQVIYQYEIPTDSASVAYGANMDVGNYGLCGPRDHYITLAKETIRINDNQITASQVAPWLEYEYYPRGDPSTEKDLETFKHLSVGSKCVQTRIPSVIYEPCLCTHTEIVSLPVNIHTNCSSVDNSLTGIYQIPVYQLRVNATDKSHQGPHELTLHFDLVEYPSSTANQEEWVINAQVEYCLVKQWNPPADFFAYFPVGTKPLYIQYENFQAPCNHEATYTTKVLTKNEIAVNSQTTPAFINHDAKSPFLAVYTDSLEDLGWYVVEVTATLDVFNYLGDFDPTNDPDNHFTNSWLNDPITGQKIYAKSNPPPDFIYDHSYNITVAILEVNETSIRKENTAPYLLPKPQSTHKIIAGQAWSYSFGTVNDFEGNNVTASVKLRNAANFVTFDNQTMTLSIRRGVTSVQTQPVFDIRLTLQDDNAKDPLSRSYDLTLVIVKDYTDPIETAIIDARRQEVVDTYDNRVYDLTQSSTTIESLIQAGSQDSIYVQTYKPILSTSQEEDQPDSTETFSSPPPVPSITSFTNDGVATISFSQKMNVPANFKNLADNKVALRKTQAVGFEEYLTESGYDTFEIRDAIEVKMLPSDSLEDEEAINIDFSWEIISFTEYEAKVQLRFDIPESVSASSSDPDNVQITFWAGDLFQAEDGQTMRPGMTISAPVIRQVDQEDGKQYIEVGQALGYTTLIVLMIGYGLCNRMNADTLPVWATYEALILISHLPMLNVTMPGSAAIVLTECAKILRLNFDFLSLEDLFIDNLDVGNSDKSVNTLLAQNGYMHTSILLNMTSFFVIYFVLLLALVVSKCLDSSEVTAKSTQPMMNGRTEVRSLTLTQKVCNAIFKFVRITMLVQLICMLINLKGDVDSSNSFESISQIMSICVGIHVLLFTGLLFVVTVLDTDPERDQDELPQAALNSLYLSMENRRRNSANIYLIFANLRYMVYALTVIMLDEVPGLQIQVLVVSSWAMSAILWRSQPYLRPVSMFSMMMFENLYVWCCAFTLMFSPEYIFRSYTISKDMGFTVCSLACITSIFGLLLMLHSLWWQQMYYVQVKERAAERAEATRFRLAELSLKKLEVIEEEEEDEDEVENESLESQRAIRQRQRNRIKQRKIRDMREHNVDTILVDPDNSKFEHEEPEELNELEKLAGIDIKQSDDQLVISEEEAGPPEQPNGGYDERPQSAGAESSYSQFMQAWKNKLFTDDRPGEHTARDGDDNVSQHSAKYSHRSEHSDSPFLRITRQQTKSLLMGTQPAPRASVIHEEVEDSDSDGLDGVILTKQERRRLNQLNNRRAAPTSYFPDIQQNQSLQRTNAQLNGLDGNQTQIRTRPVNDEQDEYDLL